MRSILAGLRQLVLPWGARTAPRTVIGGEDPIAVSMDFFSALVFYPFDDIAFLLGSRQFGDLGQVSLILAEEGTEIGEIFEATYDRSTGLIDRVDLASSEVTQVYIGSATTDDILIGSFIGDPWTQRISLDAETIRLRTGAGSSRPVPEIQVGTDTAGFEIESNEGINAGAAFSTTSATFVNVTGAPTVSFTKRWNDTRVRIDHHMTIQIDNAGTGMESAIEIDGTNYRTGRWYCAAAAVAGQPFLVGGHRVVSGIPAGTYTVRPRVRRYVGAANVIWAATDSYCSFTVAEVLE